MSTLKDVIRPRRRSWRSVQALELERRSQPTSEPLTVAYASTDWAPELKWWMSTAQPSSCWSRVLKPDPRTSENSAHSRTSRLQHHYYHYSRAVPLLITWGQTALYIWYYHFMPLEVLFLCLV